MPPPPTGRSPCAAAPCPSAGDLLQALQRCAEPHKQILELHKINQCIANQTSHKQAKLIAAQIANHDCTWNILNDLLVQASPLVHIAMQSALTLTTLSPQYAQHKLITSHTLPVIIAVTRANDKIVRLQGLLILEIMAKQEATHLCNAGVTQLLSHLASVQDCNIWHLILTIINSLLAHPQQLKSEDKKQLCEALLKCPLRRADGNAGNLSDRCSEKLLSRSDTVLLTGMLALLNQFKFSRDQYI